MIYSFVYKFLNVEDLGVPKNVSTFLWGCTGCFHFRWDFHLHNYRLCSSYQEPKRLPSKKCKSEEISWTSIIWKFCYEALRITWNKTAYWHWLWSGELVYSWLWFLLLKRKIISSFAGPKGRRLKFLTLIL